MYCVLNRGSPLSEVPLYDCVYTCMCVYVYALDMHMYMYTCTCTCMCVSVIVLEFTLVERTIDFGIPQE